MFKNLKESSKTPNASIDGSFFPLYVYNNMY